MNRVTRTTLQHGLAALALALIVPSLAHAQASRTWVSGVGDDANPCSRTAPCKTFAGAISKTAPGGEISVLDPGGYGALTITKSITINGDGTLASVLVSGTNGIVVNAGVNDVVILRNLSFNGIGTGINGVNYLSAAAVIIESCSFTGFTNNTINVSLSTNGNLVVKDTHIQGGGQGVALVNSTGRLNASLNNVDIRGTANAVHAVSGFVDISNSLFTQNSAAGVFADNISSISVTKSVISNSGQGVQVAGSATLRLADSDFYENTTQFVCSGGSLLSVGNNRKAGGSAGCSPTGSVPVQ
jgi:hypothetical protein